MAMNSLINFNQALQAPCKISYLYIKKFIASFKLMAAIEPVIHNIIALGLCAVLLVLLNIQGLLPNLGKYHAYFYYGINLIAGYQVIKSAKNSLFLPLISIALASIIIALYHYAPSLLPIKIIFFQELMLVGILGTVISIFYI